MKKRFSTEEWATYQKRRRRKLEARRLRERKRHRHFPGTNEQTRITFDGKLDPLDPDSSTVANCERIRGLLKGGCPIFVDIGGMTGFTLAGAMYLAASLEHSDGRSLVRGNFPRIKSVASEFMESGFFENFTMSPGRQLPPAQGAWRRHTHKQVTARVAAELVGFADERVGLEPGQRNAIWQNLVECMTNTRNHATMDKDHVPVEPWIAGVWCRGSVAYFAFVDQGVGICGSTHAKARVKYLRSSRLGHEPDRLVREAFEGVLGSSTRDRGRGLGLPRMQRDASSGLLLDLGVRTGRVIGKIEKMTFRKEKTHLRGTVLAWRAVGTNGGKNGTADNE